MTRTNGHFPHLMGHITISLCGSSPKMDRDMRAYMATTHSADDHSCDEIPTHIYYQCDARLDPITIPSNAGYPIEGETYVMLSTHYYTSENSFIDNSGVTLYYTDVLREHDLASMLIGTNDFLVPPLNRFVIYGFCTATCTDVFPKDGITVYGVIEHAHHIGRKLRTRHFRGGVELEPVIVDEYYEHNRQRAGRPLVKAHRIMPGDALVYECHYDATRRDRVTYTYPNQYQKEEICLSLLTYYPPVGLYSCLSYTDWDLADDILGVKRSRYRDMSMVSENKEKISALNMSFWNVDVVNKLQSIARDDAFTQKCVGPAFGRRLVISKRVKPLPAFSVPYKEDTTCGLGVQNVSSLNTSGSQAAASGTSQNSYYTIFYLLLFISVSILYIK